MPGTRLLVLHCPELAGVARPGQFLMVRCGDSSDPYLRYPLPIHRFFAEGLALFFRPGGPELGWLNGRRVGDSLDLLGPLGQGFDIPIHDGLAHSSGALSLVSWGMGLAPLLGIVDRTTCAVRLITHVATAQQVYPRELLPRPVEFESFVGHSEEEGFWQAVGTSAHWGGRLYAAGAYGLYPRLRQLLGHGPWGLHAGMAQVWVEAEMACGRGLCQGCLVSTREGPRRACTDGPVFDLLDLT
jgi:dihydroorotate dehydrogenase electron transfer subunit